MVSKLGKIFLAVLLVVTVLVLAVAVLAQGSGETTEVLLDPTPVQVGPGSPFTIALMVNYVPDPGISCYDFEITFLPGVIEFAETVGDHEWPDTNWGGPLCLNVDNAGGSISFNDISMDSPPYPTGNFTLVVLHGNATSPVTATSALHFDKADIMDPDGEPIAPATVSDGEVLVAVLPWDMNGDNCVDEGDMLCVYARCGQTGSPGWIREDVKQDGRIDVLDMILIGQHWRP